MLFYHGKRTSQKLIKMSESKIDFQKLSDYYNFTNHKEKYFFFWNNKKQKKWLIWVAVYLGAWTMADANYFSIDTCATVVLDTLEMHAK